MNFKGHDRRRPEATLDLTPLVDVVFLLLIFFLLTMTFSQPTPSQSPTPVTEAVIDIQLARAKAGGEQRDDGAVSCAVIRLVGCNKSDDTKQHG